MKLNKERITILHRTLLLTGIIFLVSCNGNIKNEGLNNALGIFFISVAQIFNLTILGTAAIVISVIGSTKIKNVLRTIGLALTLIFTLFTLNSLFGVLKRDAKHPLVFFIFGLEIIAIAICLYYSFKTKKVKNIQPHNSTDTNIVSEEDELI